MYDDSSLSIGPPEDGFPTYSCTRNYLTDIADGLPHGKPGLSLISFALREAIHCRDHTRIITDLMPNLTFLPHHVTKFRAHHAILLCPDSVCEKVVWMDSLH